MTNSSAYTALRQYSSVGVGSAVESASPHRLIQMLLEGALAKIAAALGHMQRGEAADKGRNISLAISIIGGLQASLDMEKGGDFAINLDALYEYMTVRLLDANVQNEASILTEIHGLLSHIKQGWDAISPEAPAGEPEVEAVPRRVEVAAGA